MSGRTALGGKLALARAIGRVSRGTGRGGGTTLPGRVLLRLAPDALSTLGRRLEHGSTIVSATNGKTTTAGMIAEALRAAGRTPVHNRAGSNMAWGVATALLEQNGDEGLFEVDEAWLPSVARQLDARLIVLGNLFRDQLDRYGELERLAGDWGEMVAERAGGSGLVLNADDPAIAELGRDDELRTREGVTYFGIDDPERALPRLEHAHDAKHCRRCGAPYVYGRAFVGHLGHYSCPRCGASRPDPDVAATKIELHGMAGTHVQIRTGDGEAELALPLPGLYNVYNALAALTAALRLGVPLRRAVEALATMSAPFGRVETIPVSGKALSILLVKNPIGANEVLRTLLLEARAPGAGSAMSLSLGQDEGEGELDLWIALNDRIADGRDVSWIWDADFEMLAKHVRRVTCAGTRAPEMAVRLKYAGWPAAAIHVREEIGASLDAAIDSSESRVFALPTYTALLELRRLLARRKLVTEYWE